MNIIAKILDKETNARGTINPRRYKPKKSRDSPLDKCQSVSRKYRRVYYPKYSNIWEKTPFYILGNYKAKREHGVSMKR